MTILRNFYRKHVKRIYKFNIPKGATILEIGCKDGYLLSALKPIKGIGIDNNIRRIAANKRRYKNIDFVVGNPADYEVKGTFDYIIITDSIGHFQDIQAVFSRMKKNCRPDTRIIINYYNFLWEPALRIAQFLGIKKKQPYTSWLPPSAFTNMLEVENYEVIKKGKRVIFPFPIPIIDGLLNRYIGQLPVFNSLSLIQYIIARPTQLEKPKDKTISMIVPAMNESGNIEPIVQTLPNLGKGTEIVFVEGGSKDDTWQEIQRVAKKYKKTKNIQIMQQDGKGKGDAVRKGFAHAKGDILLIYDADRTVPAKDIKKFYEAIAYNKGEFIFGSRLTYPMEKEAMRLFNLMGNKFFSVAFSWILGQPIHDTLCGTKVISKENYNQLLANRKYFGDFDPFADFDLLFGAAKLNLKMVEIPIRYQARTYGATNISRWKHGWLLIKMVFFSLGKIKFVK